MDASLSLFLRWKHGSRGNSGCTGCPDDYVTLLHPTLCQRHSLSEENALLIVLEGTATRWTLQTTAHYAFTLITSLRSVTQGRRARTGRASSRSLMVLGRWEAVDPGTQNDRYSVTLTDSVIGPSLMGAEGCALSQREM